MCTVTWSFHSRGYDLLMNRDELHTRGRALPPRFSTAGGIRFLAPIDQDADGTWIAANELGVTVGLLNRYPSDHVDDPSAPRESRGKLVLSLAGAASAADALGGLAAERLTAYRPFTLFAIDPTQILALAWDAGGTVERLQPDMPLSSSSFRSEEVVATRVALFRREFADRVTPDRLREFHSAHDPEHGAFSVCMKRPDAATKSLSHVSVNETEVRFGYYDGPPCDDPPETVHTLDRESSR